MTRFSDGVYQKSMLLPEAMEIQMPAQAEKSHNRNSETEASLKSLSYTETSRHGNILDMASMVKLKLANRRLGNRNRQRLYRERKRWKEVDEKSTSIKHEQFTKINHWLRAKNLANLRYQHAQLEFRWAGSFTDQNSAANLIQNRRCKPLPRKSTLISELSLVLRNSRELDSMSLEKLLERF